tara:strand:+ start:2860 stop:4932 length:2073 start_codon:yes stop_codon:yes gene_type:complete
MAAVKPIRIPITAIDQTRKAFASVARGLNNIRKSLFNFKTGIAAAVGVGGLGLLVKNSLDGIDKISKLSRTLGISVEDLRKLELAANLSGIELNTLARGVRTLNKGMVDFIKDGTGEAVDAFEALGISADELNQIAGDQFRVLELVAQRLDQVENSALRSSIAQELFGGRASELLLVLEDGGRELAKISKEAKTFGLILSTQAAQGVEEANDSVTRLLSVFKGLTDTITAALAPAITHLANTMQGKLIDAMGGGENAVSEFGKKLARTIIDATEQAVRAFIAFVNETGKALDKARKHFIEFQEFFNIGISEAELDRQMGAFNQQLGFMNQAIQMLLDTGRPLPPYFAAIADAMEPLNNVSELSAQELHAVADSVENAVEKFGVADGEANAFAESIRSLAESVANVRPEFKALFSEVGLNLGIFEELRASLDSTSSAADDAGESTGNAAEQTGQLIKEAQDAARMLSAQTDILLSIPPAADKATLSISALTDVLLATPPAIKPAVLSISEMTDILLSIDPAIEDVEKSVDKMAMTMEDAKLRGINSLEDGLVDLITGAKSAKDAFRDMAKSVLNDLARIAIQQSITIPLAQSMGFNVGTRARGGPVTAGRPYLVGERGPELMVPGRNGTIVPNGAMGGGGVTINQTINLTTGVQQTVRAEVLNMLPQISEAAKGAVLDARRRGGSFAATMG